MKVVIVGLGKVGEYLAKTMVKKGHTVKMIEPRRDHCERLSNILGRPVICGDGTRMEILRQAEAQDADIFIAVTGKDEVNFIACQLAKLNFGAKKTVARINNPANADVVKTFGIDIPINSTEYIATQIQRNMDSEEIKFLDTVQSGKVAVSEVEVEEGSLMEKRMIKDVPLPAECILVSILRKNRTSIPRGPIILQEGDILVAVSTPHDKAEVSRALWEAARRQ